MLLRPRISIALVVTAIVACSGGGSRSTPADAGAGVDSGDDDGGIQGALVQSLTVSSGTLRPPFDPQTTDYDVTSLNSLYPISVTAATASPGETLAIHGAPVQSGVASSFTLKAGEDFTVVASAAGLPSTTYTVHYIPSDFPAYTVTTSPGAGSEDILLTPNGEYLLMVDRAGNPLYYRTFLPNDVENFQQTTLPGGAVVYSVNVGVFDAAGWTLGVDHVMDQKFNDLADYQLPAYAKHGVLPAEGHEFKLLDTGHYIAESYVQRTIDLSSLNPAWSSQAQVMSNVLQEVDDGTVLMEWDSANVPALYFDSTYENSFPASPPSDYLHMNSIDIDPSDGNLIVSFRHTNSIVKLDRATGAIVWTLGGKEDQFGLTADQVFVFQHYVRMQPDGSMTIFDNGDGAHQTRILSLVLDQVNHKVTSFQVLYTKPSNEPPTGLMGSATPLSNGRLFIGWGGWYTTDIDPAADEIVDGSSVWSIEFGGVGVYSYRALPIAAP